MTDTEKIRHVFLTAEAACANNKALNFNKKDAAELWRLFRLYESKEQRLSAVIAELERRRENLKIAIEETPSQTFLFQTEIWSIDALLTIAKGETK